ncbi:MAG: tetratricopeptide repeat protein [Candidatus Aminicenantales bacterium]
MDSFRKKVLLWTGVTVWLLMTASAGLTQSARGRGRLSGTVEDEEGRPVASAKVTIEHIEGESRTIETSTDRKGKWKAAGLGSGHWRILIQAPGYAPFQKTVDVMQLERNPSVKAVLKRLEERIVEDVPGIELFEQGNALFKQGKYEQALAAFQEFLSANPDIFQAHFSLGNCYKETGDLEKALEEFQAVLEAADREKDEDRKLVARTLAAIGEVHLKKGDLENAQDAFKQSLELLPEDAVLAYNVGEIHFSNQQLEKAVEYFEMATRIKPEWSAPYYKLGLVYVNRAENARAIQAFEKFLELEPDTERAASVRNILNYLKK